MGHVSLNSREGRTCSLRYVSMTDEDTADCCGATSRKLDLFNFACERDCQARMFQHGRYSSMDGSKTCYCFNLLAHCEQEFTCEGNCDSDDTAEDYYLEEECEENPDAVTCQARERCHCFVQREHCSQQKTSVTKCEVCG